MVRLFKKTEVKLELLTDIDMLLMVEKEIRLGICHAVHRYQKANNKYKEEMFIISYVFRCKSSILIGNVSKSSCTWF